ncbi:Uncharacterised protein [Bordetella pertussis]|nr:Uncharacterised protein [Bordetella pertussis]
MACSTISIPSRVTAGSSRSNASSARSSAYTRWRAWYSARMRAEGLSTTTPSAPSTISMSPSRTSSRTLPSATTAGTPMLRATIAVCEVGPPRSVTKAAKRPPRSRSMSAGEISCATTTSGSLPSSWAPSGSMAEVPASTCSARSMTWRTSPPRSRRYSSSMASNCWPRICPCAVSAHSAL